MRAPGHSPPYFLNTLVLDRFVKRRTVEQCRENPAIYDVLLVGLSIC